MLLDEPAAAQKYAELATELGVARTGPLISDLFAQLAVREGRYEDA
jgi:hypothetical protein